MRAKIVNEPILVMDGVCSLVQENDKIYSMLTFGKQAVKDYIFLREGQNIQVEGSVLSDGIFPEKLMIDLIVDGIEGKDDEDE